LLFTFFFVLLLEEFPVFLCNIKLNSEVTGCDCSEVIPENIQFTILLHVLDVQDKEEGHGQSADSNEGDLVVLVILLGLSLFTRVLHEELRLFVGTIF